MSNELGNIVRMTRKGRRLAKAGKFPPAMTPMARLIAAVVSMTDGGDITVFNVTEIVDEILARHGGDIASAIDTVLSGRVSLDAIRPN